MDFKTRVLLLEKEISELKQDMAAEVAKSKYPDWVADESDAFYVYLGHGSDPYVSNVPSIKRVIFNSRGLYQTKEEAIQRGRQQLQRRQRRHPPDHSRVL